MESLDAPAGFMDDLLNFSSDIGEEEEEDDDESTKAETLTALPFSLLSSRGAKTSGIVEEEELEWISNKDAFPMVESFVDIMPNHHHPAVNNHQSPVSVLENSTSSFNSNASNGSSSGGSGPTATTITTAAIVSLASNLKVPVRARSKRRMRRRELFGGQPWQCWAKETQKISKPRGAKPSSTLGRKCQHCQTEKTPQWRAGPMGPKTLCNACGVRYKSGRLVPEYRPASSPTFSSEVHSNSHRKIVEMRRQKQAVAKPVVGPKPLEIGFIAFNLLMKDQIPVGKVIVHVSHVREASKLLFDDFAGEKKRLKETGTESTDSCFSTSSDLILRMNMPCDLCDVRNALDFLIQRPTSKIASSGFWFLLIVQLGFIFGEEDNLYCVKGECLPGTLHMRTMAVVCRFPWQLQASYEFKDERPTLLDFACTLSNQGILLW